MSGKRVMVLKFGGSVLADQAALGEVVHEVYRWRRAGYQVAVVTSAFFGKTDKLIEQVASVCPDASPETMAATVSLGECESACALATVLDRAGVPVTVLMPGAIGLHADGPADDAMPVGLRTDLIQKSLDRVGVVVIPGFVGHGDAGQPVVLGRGGSDLTALYVAAQLGSRCRLVKDVDALYEHDPKKPGPKPRRFAHVHYDDELKLNAKAIQPKAVRFAQGLGLGFELTDLNGVDPTIISNDPTLLQSGAEPGAPLKVALLGFGAVGVGVYQHLSRMPEFEVAAIAVRDADKPRDVELPEQIVTTDAVKAAGSGVDLVIEVIGGIGVAGEAIEAALKTGAHVVTANKALLAQRWESLQQLCEKHGGSLLGSASVGGGVPMLESLGVRPGKSVRSVRGVLNGTTNFVLGQVAAGVLPQAAIKDAQDRGYAEADPSGDIDGLDAAYKLCVIARTLGAELEADQIGCDAFTPETLGEALSHGSDSAIVRQVGSLDLTGATPVGEVRLIAIEPEDSLYEVPGEKNALVVTWDDGVETIVRGRGAGRWPTSESVMSDVLSILRKQAVRPTGQASSEGAVHAG
ncbi:MAG: homoserine dehydrogenase [Phycisphaerales bacterium]